MALISFSFFLFHSEVIFTRLKISPMAEKRTSLDFGLNIYFFYCACGRCPIRSNKDETSGVLWKQSYLL